MVALSNLVLKASQATQKSEEDRITFIAKSVLQALKRSEAMSKEYVKQAADEERGNEQVPVKCNRKADADMVANQVLAAF